MAKRAAVRRPKIGLALGSGSARGWSHIGVIEALVAADVVPDVVCGTSIGSLVGAAYVAGRLPKLKSVAEALTRREMMGFLDVRLTAGGLVDGNRIVAMLRDGGIDAPIESLKTPYAAVATDLENGREVWLREGPILDAVRASISIPGIFSPVRAGGRWLADGGMVNPIPVSVCRALGAEVIIAVNINSAVVQPFPAAEEIPAATGKPMSAEFFQGLAKQIPAAIRDQAAAIAPALFPARGVPGYFDVLFNAINIMQEQITRSRLAGDPPHVLLSPRLNAISLFDYHRAGEAIAEGRTCVGHALADIRRFI